LYPLQIAPFPTKMAAMNTNALIVGTGEYSTGFVGGTASSSDKGAGVVGLCLFHQRALGNLNRVLMAGTNGTKFPAIREHLDQQLGQRYRNLDTVFESFPADDCGRDTEAYLAAMDSLHPGDCVLIFTPDDTHFTIATAAVERGLHTLIAKPIVQTTADHRALIDAAERKGVLVAMEVHKRWDPIYADARDKIRDLGDFSFMNAYMSQPKSQLETFRAWAGKSSDISYYLNAHHIDFHNWAIGHRANPESVTALAATGVAEAKGIPTEDTISLAVKWRNHDSGNLGTALYTSSWIAPKSDVHSQQRFHYMGHSGEIQIDQAHRGYAMATDAGGFSSPNPLFMKYLPDAAGQFAGRSAYGYQSIEAFLEAASSVREGLSQPANWDDKLATARQTLPVTQILEAGRQSLDSGGATVVIERRALSKLS
jgi:D-galacturonate reductase